MNNKVESSAVLQFYFDCHSEDISEFVVFMPLSPHNNLDDFKKLCDEVRKEFSTGDSSGFVGSQEDYPVTVIGTGIGSSQVGDATLALAYSQCKVAIFVGSVGGLDDDMNIGDIVVVEEAVIGEGFSRYHQSQTPSEDMFGKIVQADDLLIDYLWRKVQWRRPLAYFPSQPLKCSL